MQGVVIAVPLEHAGQRLDRFLAGHAPSRAQMRRQIDAGAVLVDGKPGRADQRLRAGQRVEWTPRAPEPCDIEPQEIPLSILFEDDHVIVVNKPAGLVVHPAAGHSRDTLVNALLGRTRGGSDPRRPGIVHRLDKGTSGVMVVARSELAHARLGEQFRIHSIARRYLAITSGHPPNSGKIRTLYGRHPSNRKKFSSRVRNGKSAETHFCVVERLHAAALVEATLQTGRTHQVRVHFADRGWPIVGDSVYGRVPRDAKLREVATTLLRPALHAAVLAFDHPASSKRCQFEAPVPEDFLQALNALRG